MLTLSRTRLAALFFGATGLAGCLYPDNYLFTGDGGTGGVGGTGGMGNQGGGGAGNQGGGGTGGIGGTGGTGGTGGSPGGSGGTGGTGGSVGGSGGTGGMIPTTETNCFDGLDEDQDGDVDCQDLDCTAFAKCFPNKPANWEGPVILYEGSQAGDPACPAEYPTDAYLLNASPMGSGSCGPCACANPTGQVCTWPQNGGSLTNEPFTSSLPCANAAAGCIGELSVPPNWSGACLGAGAASGPNTGWPPDVTCDAVGNCTGGALGCNISLRSAPVSVTGGSCAASGGAIAKGPVTWAVTGHACADPDLNGGGCTASQKCVPVAPAPFLSAACVYSLGVKACPVGQYDDQHILYQNYLDTRACTACSCAAPFGASCSADITVYGSDGCSSNVLGTFPAGGCVDTPGNPLVEAWSASVVPPSGGLCTTSGGVFSGSVQPDPAQAVTFCCAAL